jgi:hypothetical protein
MQMQSDLYFSGRLKSNFSTFCIVNVLPAIFEHLPKMLVAHAFAKRMALRVQSAIF